MDFDFDIKKLLATSLKIDDYPEAVQDEILTKLSEIAVQRVLLELTASLPEEKRDQFLDLVETVKQPDLQEFIEKEIPDFETIVQKGVDTEVRAFLDAK